MSGNLNGLMLCLDCNNTWHWKEHNIQMCPSCASTATWPLARWIEGNKNENCKQ